MYVYIYIYILEEGPPLESCSLFLVRVIFCALVLCLRMSNRTAVKNKTECPPICTFIFIRKFDLKRFFEIFFASFWNTFAHLSATLRATLATIILICTVSPVPERAFAVHGGTKRDLTKVGHPFGAHLGRFMHHAGRPDVAKVC